MGTDLDFFFDGDTELGVDVGEGADVSAVAGLQARGVLDDPVVFGGFAIFDDGRLPVGEAGAGGGMSREIRSSNVDVWGALGGWLNDQAAGSQGNVGQRN